MSLTEERVVADRIGELPDPAESTELFGHHKEFSGLGTRFQSGRIQHAWLITGPKGIGKATFSFHLAKQIFSDLAVAGGGNGENEVSRIMAGAHPNLLHLTRPWDDKAKRFKTQLTVDEVRRMTEFFALTPAKNTWRICIIDAVDDMNRFAANALLKTIEEPPANTLFLLISHSPQGLLPTIRSRCQVLPLKPLSEEEVLQAIEHVLDDQEGDKAKLRKAAKHAKGSVRRAVSLIVYDGLPLAAEFAAICERLDNPDWSRIHGLADKVALKSADEQFALLMAIADDYICARATDANLIAENQLEILARWTQVWEKAREHRSLAQGYNLDRKQIILSLFALMHEAA